MVYSYYYNSFLVMSTTNFQGINRYLPLELIVFLQEASLYQFFLVLSVIYTWQLSWNTLKMQKHFYLEEQQLLNLSRQLKHISVVWMQENFPFKKTFCTIQHQCMMTKVLCFVPFFKSLVQIGRNILWLWKMKSSALMTVSVPFQSQTTLFLIIDIDESFGRTFSVEETRSYLYLYFSREVENMLVETVCRA